MPIRGPKYTGRKKKVVEPAATPTPTWSPPGIMSHPMRGMPTPMPMPAPGMIDQMRSFLDRFDAVSKALRGGK